MANTAEAAATTSLRRKRFSGNRPGGTGPGIDDQHPHGPGPALALAALGVVFGDIGTSPLYSMQTVFSLDHNTVRPDAFDVYGIISMVFWSITIIVSIKYVALVMRADNDGEGGILALGALIQRDFARAPKRLAVASMMAIIGASLFFGDSVITPAISVMSAVEGLAVQKASLAEYVLPISVLILAVLFTVQRWGTAKVGTFFGPVMLAWFAILAVLGVPHIIEHPSILKAVSPHYAVLFALDRPFVAFVAMGAVVLTITGAEALYADMGHFGPKPIRMSWFLIVFPALVLNYMGQGSMIINDPSTADNPFFKMAPSWATIPLVVLATLATVIASQAVISGAFSVSAQANRLGLLPRLNIRHTSHDEAGQIYLPGVNWMLFVGVLMLISIFRSSSRLATAYGLAVTGTLVLTTLLFLLLALEVWHWSLARIIPIGVVILGLELLFFGANITKLFSGGYLPLLIAAVITTLMVIWRAGIRGLAIRRRRMEGYLEDFIEEVWRDKIPRVPGVVIYPHPNPDTTPLALRSNVRFNHVLHETVVLVTVVTEKIPHIRHVERATVDDLGMDDDGIVQVTVRVGYEDSQDIPKAVAQAIGKSPEMNFDIEDATYCLSVLTVRTGAANSWRSLPKRIFVWMANNQATAPQAYRLPENRTVVMGEQIDM